MCSSDLEQSDLYLLGENHVEFARTCVILGKSDEAFASLRAVTKLALYSSSPREWRHDPILSRLKSDPRLEEIIRACGPL